MPHRFVWMLLVSLAATQVASSQCYDLRSTRLYEPQGRYQEWWDKPLWGGQTGNENFHVDEPGWGRVLHFALFDIGVVRKTPQGWIQYRANRTPENWCDPTPERSGLFCYMPPYQQPTPEAKIHTISAGVETWSVGIDGIARYRYRNDRGLPAKIENESNYKLLPYEFGFGGTDNTEAILNLSTGEYKFESRGYGEGFFIRRYPGTGVKIRRIDTFQAKAVLKEVPCPVSLNGSAFNNPTQVPPEREMKTTEVCVVKPGSDDRETSAQKHQLWEFVLNINQVASPDHCIQVFESPKPASSNDVQVTSADSREIHPK